MSPPSQNPVGCSGWDNGQCTGTPHCPPRCPRYFDVNDDPVLIGPFEDAHFEALVEMYTGLDACNRTSGLPPKTRTNVEAWIERMTDTGWNLVALDGDQVVGHVGVTPADATDPGFVIFVDDDHQARGIGTELMKQTVAYAAARGHESLKLSVERNNAPAIAVYENISFEVASEELATIAMELGLDSPIAEAVQRPPAEQ